ncbi:MAG: tRNA-guanine transglycosylase [Archaeoglobaceae archaeon]
MDTKPVDRSCNCLVCQDSRAYLRHLYKANELLYLRLATYYNIFFILKLMERIRECIKESFYELKRELFGF